MNDEFSFLYDIIEPDFTIGDIVKCAHFGFRAMVLNVDGQYQGSKHKKTFYFRVSNSHFVKSKVIFDDEHFNLLKDGEEASIDQPWYHLLVDGGGNSFGNDVIYVPESILVKDDSSNPFYHEQLDDFVQSNNDELKFSVNAFLN